MHRLRSWAQALKRDLMTLYFALRHPQTPWPARVLAVVVTAYALSPIDLIPDFIPVLGLLDDLIIVPAGIWLLMRMLPEAVIVDSRRRADAHLEGALRKPRSVLGLILVVALWSLAAWGLYELLA